MRHALGRVAAPGTLAKGPADGAGAGNEDTGQARLTRYARLARVSIRHTFYNASGGECPDFTVRPTGATTALLRSLGMLFKPAPDGFSVLYDTLQQKRLLSYLAARRDERDREGKVVPGAWTRLSFLLSLRNPLFVNLSDLPIDLNPATRNLYLSNRTAHSRLGEMVLLTPGSRATAAELVPVTAGQLAQPVTAAVKDVRVLAISGEEVLRAPRCRVRTEMVDGREVETTSGCTDRVFLDLGTLPEGLYTVQKVDYDGGVVDAGTWLYTSLYPMPLGFVDLLFSDPDGGGTGVYPVTLPPEGSSEGGWIVPGGVDYTLRFTRRSTWWSYYVMPQDPRGELTDLRIEHLREPGLQDGRPVRFLGPCKVRLSGGERAWRFLSACPIPLEQRSRLHLRLHGRTAAMTHPGPLMDRLPLASPQQVLPLGYAAAWLLARESLVNPDDPGARCQRLLDRLRDPEPCSRGRAGAGARAPPADFSDIIVHV